MDVENVVLFYSMHDSDSRKLMNLISENELDLPVKICVDSIKVRDRLVTDPHFRITHVPTILITYLNGSFAKFEEKDAIDWYLTNVEANPPEKEFELNLVPTSGVTALPVEKPSQPVPFVQPAQAIASQLPVETQEKPHDMDAHMASLGMAKTPQKSKSGGLADIANEIARQRKAQDEIRNRM